MAVPKTTHIWIARHGQTVSNREGRFCGHAETQLTDLGKQQAQALAARLRGMKFAAAYTSDFSRAIDTAAAVLDGSKMSVRTDPDLREINYGAWELERESEIRRRYPREYELMRNEDPAWQPPEGETMPMVCERMMGALRRIAAAHPGQNVLIVSHGTAIACMLAGVLAMPASHILRIETANCGLSHVTARGERFGVELLNETSFLAGPARPTA